MTKDRHGNPTHPGSFLGSSAPMTPDQMQQLEAERQQRDIIQAVRRASSYGPDSPFVVEPMNDRFVVRRIDPKTEVGSIALPQSLEGAAVSYEVLEAPEFLTNAVAVGTFRGGMSFDIDHSRPSPAPCPVKRGDIVVVDGPCSLWFNNGVSYSLARYSQIHARITIKPCNETAKTNESNGSKE